MIAGRFIVPTGHPCLPGHFPGRPLVPAVLLLDEVLALIAPHRPGADPTPPGIASAKFLHPVRPDEAVEVTFDPATGAFGGMVAGRPVLRGQLARAG